MQVSSVNNQQQNFGMAFTKMGDGAVEALKKRLKEKDVAKLQELIDSQKANKNVDIFLYTVGSSDSTRLGANIFPKSPSKTGILMKQPSEGILEMLRSPIHFVESLCKKADKMSKNIESTQNVNDVVDSVAKNSLMVDITKH